MEKKRHTPEQIIKKLRAVEKITGQGKTVAEGCKVEAIGEQTYYRWKQQYSGMNVPSLKELKQLKQENTELKKWSPSRPWICGYSKKSQRENGRPGSETLGCGHCPRAPGLQDDRSQWR